MTPAEPKKLSGRAVLEGVRLALMNEAARIISLEDGLRRTGLSIARNQERMAVADNLGAAADIITYALGAGYGAKHGRAPDWVDGIADQARAALLMALDREDGGRGDDAGSSVAAE